MDICLIRTIYLILEGFYRAIFFLIYRRGGIGIFSHQLNDSTRIIILILFHFRPFYIFCIYLFFNIIKKIDRSIIF